MSEEEIFKKFRKADYVYILKIDKDTKEYHMMFYDKEHKKYIKDLVARKNKLEEKMKHLKEEIHKILDVNGITRAYQIKIDEYFEKILEDK